MNAEQWTAQGAFHTVHGRTLFVVDTGSSGSGADGEAGDKPVLVVLHGYPTSSHDYYRVLPALAERFRVIVHDHLGFGLSDKPEDYSYGLLEQADFALLLWQHLGVTSAHVVGHDYGTSVATELLARWNLGFRPVTIRSMTLGNGSMHIERAQLRFIQKLLRHPTWGPIAAQLTSQRLFDRNMRRLWHDRSTLSQDDLDTMWTLLLHGGGRAVLPKVTQYLHDRVRYWHRWIGALQNAELPLHFLWGTEDPVVGREVAELHHAESPGSTLTLLEGVGHYPMHEAPDRWAEGLMASLG